MLIFFVFVKLLSLMNIERVGVTDFAERKARRCRHARHGQPTAAWVWNLYRKYAGSGGINECQGEKCPWHFAVVYDIISSTNKNCEEQYI